MTHKATSVERQPLYCVKIRSRLRGEWSKFFSLCSSDLSSLLILPCCRGMLRLWYEGNTTANRQTIVFLPPCSLAKETNTVGSQSTNANHDNYNHYHMLRTMFQVLIPWFRVRRLKISQTEEWISANLFRPVDTRFAKYDCPLAPHIG